MRAKPKPRPIGKLPSTRRSVITGGQLQARAEVIRLLGDLGASHRAITPPTNVRRHLADLQTAGLVISSGGTIRLSRSGAGWYAKLAARDQRCPLLITEPVPARLQT
jgi:hypothetical protein